jgi:hypothetical protein
MQSIVIHVTILISHLRSDLQTSLFLSASPIKILCSVLISPIRGTCFSNLSFRPLTTQFFHFFNLRSFLKAKHQVSQLTISPCAHVFQQSITHFAVFTYSDATDIRYVSHNRTDLD